MKILKSIFLSCFILLAACKEKAQKPLPNTTQKESNIKLNYAKGFSITKQANGITILKITSPWPNAESAFTYALIPKDKAATITLNKNDYDAIVTVPIKKLVATSTTHIPTLESLGVLDKLVGFPNTDYISSTNARTLINEGKIEELGVNESLNTEMVIALNPDVVVGFGIDNNNKTYSTLQRSNIPVVFNGDWTEETPLGKAEWIKFFAPFFNAEAKADSIFKTIETDYNNAKALAKKATNRPSVLTGGLYKDLWHVAGGKSWMAQFLKDANANYLWSDLQETGGVGLSIESVFDKAGKADFWISPSSNSSYKEVAESSQHYTQFDAYKNKKIYTITLVKGETGGVLFFELAPNRPDLVLKDLISIFHPEVLPNYQTTFFKPLQ
ncbi:ABC transporter substrate-binding protein [Cellulophaga lytica]|uniref:ABC-type transporter, periplasmic subunit n=1 Tax=Cellulophaga lytica (strain ATCC 23178 / DSM 7489 / JCM 8516 / NBRC 14961 / NCIMB 1423 / VKM B-1433 / Cy l20) TaxID=867900 RepID=F0RGG4_CELLC|nr:ABC transporter substrate-binding protein [Cellulophaga lytica]ADY27989.1 ABC-type transporter, periplasmic subunit [Cellulophaga lytica DSM 7489]WQG77820.1 ABC transporter substrate-binding protein [Cellulophaga lytica]